MGPLKALKIIKRLNKLLTQVGSIDTSTNVITQILAMVASAVALFTDFLPGEWRPVAVAAGVLIQAITALLAHGSNPDGGNVTESYDSDAQP